MSLRLTVLTAVTAVLGAIIYKAVRTHWQVRVARRPATVASSPPPPPMASTPSVKANTQAAASARRFRDIRPPLSASDEKNTHMARFVTYNVLADGAKHALSGKHDYAAPDVLTWAYRC